MNLPKLKNLFDTCTEISQERERVQAMETEGNRILKELGEKGDFDSPNALARIADAQTKIRLAHSRSRKLQTEDDARAQELETAYRQELGEYMERVEAARKQAFDRFIESMLPFWLGDKASCLRHCENESNQPPLLHALRNAGFQPSSERQANYNTRHEVHRFFFHIKQHESVLKWCAPKAATSI